MPHPWSDFLLWGARRLSAAEYKVLLRKYIRFVEVEVSGVTGIGDCRPPEGFTEAEWGELRGLQEELDCEPGALWRAALLSGAIRGYSVPWTLEEAKRLETPDTGPGPVGGSNG